jgi:FAD:protein FMN transferase
MTKEVYSDNFSAMGTRFAIVLPGTDAGKGRAISILIKDEIERLENKISRFIPDSSVSHLNQFACKYPVTADEELWGIIKECRHYNILTCGAFDITLKAVADYWNRIELNFESADEPPMKLNQLLSAVGMNKIELNEDEHSVFLKSSEVEIDLGAIGKGLALKNVHQILVQNEIENAFVSFGESSILALGSHPGGNCWKIGIPDAFNPNKNVYTLELNDCTISVSGNTHNNIIAGRVNIINPFTGKPVKETRTILVAHKNPVLAEVLSTSFMVLKDEQIREVLNYYPDASAVSIEYNQDKKPEITGYKEKILI